MRTLVIGGTRFIGLHVVPQLLELGHQLTVLNNDSQPLPWLNQGVKHIHGDRNDEAQLTEALAGQEYDAVVDMILYNSTQAELIIKVLAGRLGHYLMLSTRSVYATPVSSPIREGDPLDQNPANAFGYNKAQAEGVLLEAYAKQGFPATIMRLPAIYGEHDYQIRERYFIKRLFDRRPHMLLPDGGAGVNQRDYAGNIAAQAGLLLQKPQSIGEIYNCGHLRVQNYRALVSDAMKITGHQMALYSVPAPSFPVIPDLASPVVNIQSTAKLEALGWVERFTPYEGLARTIAWFSDQPDEILPNHRNKERHFDYQREDELIASIAVALS